MHSSPQSIRIVFSLAIAWSVASQGAALGQQVELTIPKDDPSPNSWVASSVAFSPDGKTVAAAYGMPLGMLQEPKPGQTILWTPRSGKRTRTIPALKDGVHSVAFAPDGKSIVVLEYTATIRMIAVADGREQHQLETHRKERSFFSVAVFPSGKHLAAGLAAEFGGREATFRSGMSTAGNSSGFSTGITAPSPRWRFLPTVRCWPAEGGTGPPGSGTHPRESPSKH